MAKKSGCRIWHFQNEFYGEAIAWSWKEWGKIIGRKIAMYYSVVWRHWGPYSQKAYAGAI